MSPLSLAASLSVASCSSRDLLPIIQASFTADVIKLTLSNDSDLLGCKTPELLRPFKIHDSAVKRSQAVLEIEVVAPVVGVRHFAGHESISEAKVRER